MKVQSDCPQAGVSSNGTVVYSGNMDANSPPALILIDLQKAIDHPSWGQRNNPQAETNVTRLLAAWRSRRLPVYHVRHDSVEPASTYRPGQPGTYPGPPQAFRTLPSVSNSSTSGPSTQHSARGGLVAAPNSSGRASDWRFKIQM